jgi:hypothetical protein
MGGRLEHEIRLLPQVLSCSFSADDYVVVLIDPSADPLTIQLAVERILQNDGSGATVRVIGPPETTAVAATRTMSPLVATASIATVAAIGIGALVGGLAAVQHPKPTLKTPVAAATAAPFDTIDALRGLQFTVQRSGSPVRALPVEQLPVKQLPAEQLPAEQLPAARLPAARLPVETPDRTRRTLPVSLGAAASVRQAATSSRFRPAEARAAATSPRISSVRAKPHEQRGGHAGKRLPHWSEVLLPPHPHQQKGRAR